MATYLIWPDIHLRIALLRSFLNKNKGKFDGFIFGGDIFHQFNDTVEQNKQAAIFLKNEILTLPNCHYLKSNHDFSHQYCIGYRSNYLIYCPGWTETKDKAIHSILKSDDWAKFKDYTLIDGWLFSHAGFAPSIYNHPINGFDINYLDKQLKLGYDTLAFGKFHEILSIGYARGGNKPFGGHLWNDFDCEFIPLPNFKQVVFHSPRSVADCKYLVGDKIKTEVFCPSTDQRNPSISVCLDTNNRQFGILTDGYLEIKETEDYL